MPKERKSIQILRAIKEKHFPILVTGPSGVGKSYAILSAVKSLQLPYLYVDVSQFQIRRSLRGGVTHTVLYRLQDLENIRYTGNLVVETTIHGVEEKLAGCTHIKMKSSEFRKKEKIQHRKYKEGKETVDVFRFIGRIFYKKLRLGDIENSSGWVLYYGVEGREGYNTKGSSKSSCNKAITNNSCNKEGSKGSCYSLNTKLDNCNLLYLTKKQPAALRRFLISDESSSDTTHPINYSLPQPTEDHFSSFNEDLIFSSEDRNRETSNDTRFSSFDEDQIFSSEDRKERKLNTPLKRLLAAGKDVPDDPEGIQSFESGKIEALLYSNFPYFLVEEDLLPVYETLSLTGISGIFLESFIGALLKSRVKEKKTFFSFKTENWGKAEPRNSWQYKFSDLG